MVAPNCDMDGDTEEEQLWRELALNKVSCLLLSSSIPHLVSPCTLCHTLLPAANNSIIVFVTLPCTSDMLVMLAGGADPLRGGRCSSGHVHHDGVRHAQGGFP